MTKDVIHDRKESKFFDEYDKEVFTVEYSCEIDEDSKQIMFRDILFTEVTQFGIDNGVPKAIRGTYFPWSVLVFKSPEFKYTGLYVKQLYRNNIDLGKTLSGMPIDVIEYVGEFVTDEFDGHRKYNKNLD